MMANSSEEEDIFFDALDDIEASPSPVPLEEFDPSEYNMWTDELQSISERRRRFLLRAVFTELRPWQASSFQMDKTESLYCHATGFHEIERPREDSETVSRSPPCYSNGSAEGRGHGYCWNELKQNSPSESQKTLRVDAKRKGWRGVWKSFMLKRCQNNICDCGTPVSSSQTGKLQRVRVRRRKKMYVELTGVYRIQEIEAHKGQILTMKFSPDGQYLASGGRDGVVRIWKVTEASASLGVKSLSNLSGEISIQGRKSFETSSIIFPEKMFKIEEVPLQEFCGHTGTVLALSWSKDDRLLSSSEDKTVRLWQVGQNRCLGVFQHRNYVSCVQFNPVDERYFASGSIDGKVRVWGVSENRVVDWVDARDIVTAVCYKPEGQGIVVGSITGKCRFYISTGNHLELEAELCLRREKSSANKRITGFQFHSENPERLIVTSADSRVLLLDGFTVMGKYKGLSKSGIHSSASFTSNGRHIVSVGEDSRVYFWNYRASMLASPKQRRATESCECFSSEGVSVAIPWVGRKMRRPRCSAPSTEEKEEFDILSLDNWFLSEKQLKNSATWPEEKLPVCFPLPEGENPRRSAAAAAAAAWGQVIVTASWDGKIRSFQNYGLPVRL